LKQRKNKKSEGPKGAPVYAEVLHLQKHEYDIDLIDVFRALEKLVQGSSEVLSPRFDGANYQQTIRELIESYCRTHAIDAEKAFRHGFLLLTHEDGLYEFALALEVLTRDIYKLRPFLAAQQNRYPNAAGFLNLLEFRVYDLLDRHSPLADNAQRKAWIMNWIEEQRNGLPLVSREGLKPREQDPSVLGLTSDNPAESVIRKEKRAANRRPGFSFEEYFYTEENHQTMLRALETNEIIVDKNKWIGRTNIKSEIHSLIAVLKQKGYIRHDSKTALAKCFCNYFGIELKDRSLRFESKTTHEQIEYYNLIIPNVQPVKRAQ
jgi:hypothetical protein